jgi:hypothetical protein
MVGFLDRHTRGDGSHFGRRIESEKLISEIKTLFCRAIGA